MSEPGSTDWIILPSANKHGVDDQDIVHAIDHHYRIWKQEEDAVTMFVGPSRSGQMLEVGVIVWYGVHAVAHAMPARDQYL